MRAAMLLAFAAVASSFSLPPAGLRAPPRAWYAGSGAGHGRCRSAPMALRMKEGPIGRGRGAMSQEQMEQALAQVDKIKTTPKRTPEEARARTRVVNPGEISPNQATQADEAFLRTKAAHSVRGPVAGAGPGGESSGSSGKFTAKQRTEAALRGKVFVPKSEMSAADVALMRQRQEMARQVLSRYAPPTEEGVVYIPDWNENEAGKTVRQAPGLQTIGKAPDAKDLASGTSDFKSPMEVIEMLRTMNFHLRDTFRALAEADERAAAPPVEPSPTLEEEAEQIELSDEEMSVMRVSLLREHWLSYLEDSVAGQEPAEDGARPLLEMDPAKHAPQVRGSVLPALVCTRGGQGTCLPPVRVV